MVWVWWDQPVETLPSRLERGVLKVEVSIEEAVAIVEGLLPYEVRAWLTKDRGQKRSMMG